MLLKRYIAKSLERRMKGMYRGQYSTLFDKQLMDYLERRNEGRFLMDKKNLANEKK